MRSSPWFRLLMALPVVVLVFIVQAAVWAPLRPRIGVLATAAVGSLIAALGGWGAFVFIARVIERRPAVEFGRLGAARELTTGLALGGGLFGVTIGVLALAGSYSAAPTHQPELALVPLLLAVGAGVLEEVMFRGVLFRFVEQALGTWIALAVSSAFFGFGHLMNPGATLQGALAIVFEAGVLLGAAYLVTRRLWLPIGIHAGWNFVQSGIFGVPTSGVPLQGLLRGRLDGPAWLTGGDFGAEGSIAALVICTAAGVWLLQRARRDGRFVVPPWRRPPAATSPSATARSPAISDPGAAPSGP